MKEQSVRKGTLFEDAGYPATPSQQDPAPAEGEPFFSGGHNTRVHGCLNAGPICGVQIEHHRSMRETDLIPGYAKALYDVYDEYLLTNFTILVQSPAQGLDTLKKDVADLERRGELSRWDGAALSAKLKSAERQLERGNQRAAERVIDSFVYHVKALSHSGKLSATDAMRLTTIARRIAQVMNASG